MSSDHVWCTEAHGLVVGETPTQSQGPDTQQDTPVKLSALLTPKETTFSFIYSLTHFAHALSTHSTV